MTSEPKDPTAALRAIVSELEIRLRQVSSDARLRASQKDKIVAGLEAELGTVRNRLKSREARNRRLVRRMNELEQKLLRVRDSLPGRLGRPLLRGTLELPPPVRAAPPPQRPSPADARTAAVVVPSTRETGEVQTTATFAPVLENKLWGGFSSSAIADLIALRDSPLAASVEVAYAAWALARWYDAADDPQRAYENLVICRLAARNLPNTSPVVRGGTLFEAKYLAQSSRASLARELLEKTIATAPDDLSLELAMANTFVESVELEDGGDVKRLAWINRIYEGAGVLPIEKIDPDQPLGIGNITASRRTAAPIFPTNPLVSVIVPAFNAVETISFAVGSLLRQTWQNLEVIVVDDCSTDGTADIVDEIASRDERVACIRLRRNEGVNRARNHGLEATTGDFITVHDADDWDHPQKIELHLQQMLSNPHLVGNLSLWARVSPDLQFCWSYRANPTFIEQNGSSLFLSRSSVEKLGYWMPDRDSGDTEYLMRARKLGRVDLLPSRVPLAFGLHRPTSLTQAKINHVRTIHFGPRREYREAASHWHATLEDEQALHVPRDAVMPFPVPWSLLETGEEGQIELDLLVVMDFNLGAGAYNSTVNYVRAAVAAGLKVGIFHWRRYDLDVTAGPHREVRQLAHDRQVRVIVAGETVKATTAIIGYPSILNHRIDRFPDVSVKHLVVIINQMAERLTNQREREYDPGTVRENLKSLFGTEGTWVPISALVRDLMKADDRYPLPLDDVWTPLIDTISWCRGELRWRGTDRPRPVIGRHGRDHPNKWPSSPEAIRAAYAAERPCDVRLLGGADHALDIIGEAPSNWRVFSYGSMDVRKFLEELDFFVHFHHEDYVEEFGRAIIEAMAVGCVAVLPKHFEAIFGDAAIYADADHVWATCECLWGDENRYLAQAAAGRAFVLSNCAYAEFPRRLDRLAQLSRPELSFQPDQTRSGGRGWT